MPRLAASRITTRSAGNVTSLHYLSHCIAFCICILLSLGSPLIVRLDARRNEDAPEACSSCLGLSSTSVDLVCRAGRGRRDLRQNRHTSIYRKIRRMLFIAYRAPFNAQVTDTVSAPSREGFTTSPASAMGCLLWATGASENPEPSPTTP